ncbi:MAG: hypothetical protein IPK13_00465 [Deltaproteobacteria bacterium]|nr:hypothetical protein [Deltaproteobacteria bacterium]
MTVILINRARRMKLFTLAHATYCEVLGSCGCTVVDRRTRRRVAQSLTLAAGARSSELPEAVLKLGDVIRAVASGDLGVERVAPKPKPRASKTERFSVESRRARPRKGSR